MKINTDINILGSLQDWNLIKHFYVQTNIDYKLQTPIKTEKSVQRFSKAIINNFLTFRPVQTEQLFVSLLHDSGIDSDMLMFLFWHASYNNELFHYLNTQVFFPAFYSGRVSLKADEVMACLNDLKTRESTLREWSDSTISTTASKYLTLLRKFGLMEGSATKSIVHPHLSDAQFVIFVYWIVAVSEHNNLLKSNWLKYSFSELQPFLDTLMQKRFSRFFHLNYTGDKLNIKLLIPYENIYDNINQP